MALNVEAEIARWDTRVEAFALLEHFRWNLLICSCGKTLTPCMCKPCPVCGEIPNKLVEVRVA